MPDLFKEVIHPYHLRNNLICGSYKIKTVSYDIEAITYFGLKTWSIVPDKTNESASLEIFRQKVKLWEPDSCPCRISKKYITNVGFVNLSWIITKSVHRKIVLSIFFLYLLSYL